MARGWHVPSCTVASTPVDSTRRPLVGWSGLIATDAVSSVMSVGSVMFQSLTTSNEPTTGRVPKRSVEGAPAVEARPGVQQGLAKSGQRGSTACRRTDFRGSRTELETASCTKASGPQHHSQFQEWTSTGIRQRRLAATWQ
jgi:hypothetical protein